MNTNVRSRLQGPLLRAAVAAACTLGAGFAWGTPYSILTPTHDVTFAGEVDGGAFKFNDIFAFDTGGTSGGIVDFKFSDVSNIKDLKLTLKDADGSFVSLVPDGSGKGFLTTGTLDTSDLYLLDVSGLGKKHGDSEFAVTATMTAPVPEPAEWALIGTGLLMLGAWSLRRRAHSAGTAAQA